MNDFESYADVAKVEPITLTTYRNLYKRLYECLGKGVKTISQKKIIDSVNKLNMTPNTKDALIKVAIIIKKHHNKPFKQLNNFKISLQNNIQTYNNNKKQTLKKELPSKEDLFKYLEVLKNNENKIIEYLVNYLIIHFNTRNKDLNVVITKLRNVANNKNDNYLYINNKQKRVEYIRNIYKTDATYGQKINIITDLDFINKISQLKQKYLLETKDKQRINQTSLNKVVSRMTLNNLGTANYFKILSTSVDKKDLNKLSNNRGTDVKTIINNYVL